MSDLNQINTALERLFNEEGQRIVFWNDPEREFQNTLPFVMLEGVTALRLDQVGALEAKIRIERDEPDAKFLLYAPTEEPERALDSVGGRPIRQRGIHCSRARFYFGVWAERRRLFIGVDTRLRCHAYSQRLGRRNV